MTFVSRQRSECWNKGDVFFVSHGGPCVHNGQCHSCAFVSGDWLQGLRLTVRCESRATCDTHRLRLRSPLFGPGSTLTARAYTARHGESKCGAWPMTAAAKLTSRTLAVVLLRRSVLDGTDHGRVHALSTFSTTRTRRRTSQHACACRRIPTYITLLAIHHVPNARSWPGG